MSHRYRRPRRMEAGTCDGVNEKTRSLHRFVVLKTNLLHIGICQRNGPIENSIERNNTFPCIQRIAVTEPDQPSRR